MSQVSPVQTGATAVGDFIGFSPLPAVFLISYLMPGRPVGANLAAFSWSLMAGGVTMTRMFWCGTTPKKSLEFFGALGACGLLALFSFGRSVNGAYKCIEYGSGEYLVKMIGNGLLCFAEVGAVSGAFVFGLGSMAVGSLRGNN